MPPKTAAVIAPPKTATIISPSKVANANTRRRNGSLSTPDELQDIKNREDGRKFLEKHLLLCPPGEPASNGALAICLHQITAMAGIPKTALNTIIDLFVCI